MRGHWAPGRGRHAAVAGFLGLVCIAGPAFLNSSQGSAAPRFETGTAWLLSTSVGLLTKVDGGSARPMAQLALPDGADPRPVQLVQQDSGVVLRSGNTVWSVDDARERFRANALAVGGESLVVSGPRVYGIERHAPTRATGGRQAAYDVQSAAVASGTGQGGPTVRLSAPVVSAAAGRDGSLWVAQTGADTLVRIDGDRVVARERVQGARGSLQLTSAADTEVVAFDTLSLRLTVLPEHGPRRSLSTGDRAQAASTVQLGVPSTASALVPLVLGSAQTLVTVNTANGALTTTRLPVRETDHLGRPVAAGRLVYVPDNTSGDVLVVDTDSRRVRETVRLAEGGAGTRLGVFVRNGLVWGNDETGPLAMVVDQGRTRVLTKYSQTLSTAPTYSGGPALRPTPSATATPTPSPDRSSPTPRPSSARPSPSPSASGSPPASAAPTSSGPAPTGSPNGGRPVLLKTIAVASGTDFRRTSVTWDPASARLVTAHGPGSGQLWDVSAPRTPRRLYPLTDSEGGDIRGAVFAAQGSLLFVAGRQAGTSYQDFTIYSTAGAGAPHPLSATTMEASQDRGIAPIVAVSPNGGAFAVEDGGAGGGWVNIWNNADPTAPVWAATLAGTTGLLVSVGDITFSPDNRTMAVHTLHGRTNSGYFYLVDVTDIRHPHIISTTLLGSATAPVVFSPNGRFLLGPGTGTAATLWDVRNHANPVAAGTLPTSSTVFSAAFNQDGSLLAVGEKNGTVTLWKVGPTGHPAPLRTLTRRPSSIDQVSFDPRTGLLGVADNTTVQLWDLD
ncbi:WD40 repeat domain-containing protein [Streptomyces mirabilis]|uniref:WD40 repeat domain-containing protein n=1 Tax=Streptomyces mirabilis TaxID=68239 RepID=UPI0036C1A12D